MSKINYTVVDKEEFKELFSFIHKLKNLILEFIGYLKTDISPGELKKTKKEKEEFTFFKKKVKIVVKRKRDNDKIKRLVVKGDENIGEIKIPKLINEKDKWKIIKKVLKKLEKNKNIKIPKYDFIGVEKYKNSEEFYKNLQEQ